MKSFLLIESRSDDESPDVSALLDLASRLHEAGHEVSLFLIQNAVLMAGSSPALAEVVRRGVPVWADEHSVCTRGLDPQRVSATVALAGPAELVRTMMTPGVVPVWH